MICCFDILKNGVRLDGWHCLGDRRGGGANELYGGAGDDKFTYMTDRHIDEICDFRNGIDKIDVSQDGARTGIDALSLDSGSGSSTRLLFKRSDTAGSAIDLLNAAPALIDSGDSLL